MNVDPALQARFAADLDAFVPPGERIGLAVSGGPDSLALLLLATAARPRLAEAATVDHGLRPESAMEADFVAQVCAGLAVRHRTLPIAWPEPPQSAIQERARAARYNALAEWLIERGIRFLLTGHHADDQAETLLMRLSRGSGVRGLAGMRAIAPLPGHPELKLVRPLLGWRRSELEEICAAASISAANDPSNADEQFERVRVRRAVSDAEWLDPTALARSAKNLAAADDALEWAAAREVKALRREGDNILYTPGDAPQEIRRRVLAGILCEAGSEGADEPLRGRELDRLLAELDAGRSATLRGIKCTGGPVWRFEPAPPRRR